MTRRRREAIAANRVGCCGLVALFLSACEQQLPPPANECDDFRIMSYAEKVSIGGPAGTSVHWIRQTKTVCVFSERKIERPIENKQ